MTGPFARKRFGQHFLVQTGIAERIVALAGLGEGATVLEIGPGRGALTDGLAAASQRLVLEPVIKGTRITVENILERLAAGEPVEQVLEALPRLKREDVFAALNYAVQSLKSEIIYPIAA